MTATAFTSDSRKLEQHENADGTRRAVIHEIVSGVTGLRFYQVLVWRMLADVHIGTVGRFTSKSLIGARRWAKARLANV